MRGIISPTQAVREESFHLTGHIVGIVKRAATGIEEIVIDQSNTIQVQLKRAIRDTMNNNVDFAISNLQATQVPQASLSAALNGKDGICVFDDAGITIADMLGFMASAVHPSDPSGEVYRQWQGVYQNLTGVTETSVKAHIGQGYTHAPGSAPFDGVNELYASASYALVTLLNNDIITINWKITIG